MLKSKLWVLLLIASCAPKNPPRIVTGSWLHKQKELSAERLPASSKDNAICKNELFTTEEVRREALQYEAQLNTGERVTGTWKHLNLAKLPVPQAKFLKEVGDNVGDVNLTDDNDTYSRCKDAVCVVNTVYKSRDGLEGWMVYLWYLKMGNILSFKNKIYDQKDPRGGVYNSASYALQDYLFSREELLLFWRLSELLPSTFKTLPYLKEIQRIPGTARFEMPGQEESCGLSFYQGYILLTNACLDLTSPTFKNGQLYINYSDGSNLHDVDKALGHQHITHEMAHQIDFHWGREIKTNELFSKTKTWMDLGQWSLQEYRDGKGATVSQKWTTTLDPKYFMGTYAQGSAIEHFADTASFYYYSPEETKKTIPPQTYQFISRKVFEGLEYDKISSLKRFEKSALLKMAPKLLALKNECANSLEAEHPSSNVKSKKRSATSPKVRRPGSVEESSCLLKLLDQAVSEAKLSNANGCLVLNSSNEETLFRADLKEALIAQIEDHSKIVTERPEDKDQIEAFYNKMADDHSTSLNVLTDCHGERNEKNCYEEGLQSAIEEKAPRPLKESNLDNSWQKNYLAANSYEVAKEEGQKLYRDFIFSQTAQINSSVASLWKDCLAVDSDNSEAPMSGPFSVGEKWMVSSQYNCINKEIPLRIKRLITEMTFDAMKVADEKESAILLDLTTPIFVKELSRLYEKEAKIEDDKIRTSIQKLRPQHMKMLTQSFYWANGLGKKMQASCKAEVQRKLPQNLRYFNSEEVYKSYTQEICSQVASSEAFKNWAKTRPELVAQDVTDTYLEVLAKEAEKKATRCEEAFPASNAVTRFMKRENRSRCYQEKWEEVETAAWNEAIKKYPASRFERSILLNKIFSEAQAIKDGVQVRRF